MRAIRSMLLPLVALTGAQLFASVSVELSAPATSIVVGETLNITATAHDSATSATRFSYQFTVRPHNVGAWIVTQDFYWTNTFPWTPSDHEGDYDIGVTAWSEATHNSSPNFIEIHVSPRVTSSSPVVSNTNNALVALYSAPPCSAPASMRVKFYSGSVNSAPILTPLKPCNGLSMNFYIGGMRASTTYTMQHLLYSGWNITPGPAVNYKTGSIPSEVRLPSHFVLLGPTPPTSVTYPFLLHATDGPVPYASDMSENVVWYLTAAELGDNGYLTRVVDGGTFIGIQSDPVDSAAVCPPHNTTGCGDSMFLREYDMAGNVIRQTSWVILNDEINALRAGQHNSLVNLNFISHEGIRLPNGYTVTLVTDEQVKDQGNGPVDVLGDAVVVLDTNWQVVWAWDAFDLLDIHRKSIILPGTCVPAGPGCPPQLRNVQSNGKPYTVANDWSHANSIYYDPKDGNLIVSFRNQSLVAKINFQNGSGNGLIIWKFGYGGNFSLPPGAPVSDWPSGQHDVEIQANGLLTLFDNNNPSAATQQPGGDAHGQVWSLDTSRMVATPVMNVDLGVVSPAVGSAVLLANGNYQWQAGFIGGNTSQTFEYTPSGNLVYKEQSDALTYRAFRLHDLYTPYFP